MSDITDVRITDGPSIEEVTSRILGTISGNQVAPITPTDADQLAAFLQSSQQKLDLTTMVAGAIHIGRFGRNTKLLGWIDMIIFNADPDQMTFEQFKEAFKDKDMFALRKEVLSDMDNSLGIVSKLAKQPPATSPENMAGAVISSEAAPAIAKRMSGLTPERREKLRKIIEAVTVQVEESEKNDVGQREILPLFKRKKVA